MGEPVYRSVIVTLSGEALAGAEGFGIAPAEIARFGRKAATAVCAGLSWDRSLPPAGAGPRGSPAAAVPDLRLAAQRHHEMVRYLRV